MNNEIPQLLTPIETMDALRVSYSTLRRMIAVGELRAVRVGTGKTLRIPVSEVARIANPAHQEEAA